MIEIDKRERAMNMSFTELLERLASEEENEEDDEEEWAEDELWAVRMKHRTKIELSSDGRLC